MIDNKQKCGNCKNLGEEVNEQWILPSEHYHICPIAYSVIGYVEEGDDACGKYQSKQNKNTLK